MKYLKIHKKYTLLTSIFIIIILLFVFINSKNTIKILSSLFKTNSTATVFQGSTTGNWNRPETWGLHSTLTPFLNASGMDVDSNGFIYVSDGNGGGNHRVVVLNPDGTASTTIGGTGSVLEGQIGQIGPTAIAISSLTGNIYIGDYIGNRIVILNPDGTYLTSYTNPDFNGIRAIGLSPTDVVYVGNSGGNKISVLEANGTASTSINFTGTPNDIDISTITRRIYVSSSDSNQIKILNTDGSVFATYGGVPTALTLGVDDTIYYTWTDTNNGNGYLNYLVILHPDGTASSSSSLPSGSTGMGGISLAPSGYIYTINSITHGGIVVRNQDGTASTTYNGLALPTTFIPVEGIDFPGPGDTIHINTGVVNLTANQNINILNIYSGGTLNLNGYTLNISSTGGIINSGGTIDLGGGKINYVGLWSTATSGPWDVSATWGGSNPTPVEGVDYPGPNDNAVINYGTTTLNQNQSVRNITIETGGTLDLNGNTLNVFGDWTTNGGMLKTNTGNPGTVNFASNNTQSISGDATFENLTKISTQNSTLLFGTNNLTTILNDLNLSGAAQGVNLSISPTGFIAPQQTLSIPVGSGTLDAITDGDGNILVYSKAGDIKKYDANGNFIESFGTGYINTPIVHGSIDIDGQGNILVTDEALFYFFGAVPAIEKFSATGTHISSFGSYGTGDGQFNVFPAGLAIDSLGNIYVGENNNRIQKFDSNGNYLSQFGSYGNGDGQLWGPLGIAIDVNDNIFVMDTNNNRVQKFNSSGVYQSQFGSAGTLNSQFANSYGGIALDAAGNIYVVDKGNNRIQIFYPNGFYKAQFGSAGSGSGQFNGPQGIYIDEFNNIYIADTNNNRVVKYSYTTFPNFNILHTDNGEKNLSYLAVSGSTNTSTSTFNCTSCVDLGNNINWNIPILHRRNYSIVNQISTTTATTTEEVATTTATTTEQQATTTEKKTPEPKPQEEVVIQKTRRTQTINTEQIKLLENTATSSNINSTTTELNNNSTSTEKTESNTQKVINSVTENIKNTFLTKTQIKSIEGVVNSDVGAAVTKTIATTGVVAGASAAITAVTFANPITLAEIWLIPARIFGLFMGALGIRRKNRPWGTVYDAVTKRPIDPAYVSLLDIETGKEVASAITDLDGRYSFSVLPGKYKIVASKTNYLPSTKMIGKTFDEVYPDLYHGDVITIQKEGEIITKNIPMDPQTFDWNEFAKTKMNVNTFIKERDITWAKISKIVFIVGFVVSFLGLIFSPAPYNFIIAVFYITAYILNYFVLKTKKAGSITESKTNIPLSFAIIKIFREGDTEPMIKKIADKFGNYYALVPKGKYFIKIDKKNDDGSYGEVFQSGMIDVLNGVINTSVKI